MRTLVQLVLVSLLLEATNLARASAAGAWLPDFSIAIVAALALAGKDAVIVPAAIFLALLRAPATLADPLSGVGAILAFALLVRAARHFFFRENAVVAFAAGAAGALLVATVAFFAERARGGAPAIGFSFVAFALATGAVTMLLTPSMRAFTLTRPLLERRFGEAT